MSVFTALLKELSALHSTEAARVSSIQKFYQFNSIFVGSGCYNFYDLRLRMTKRF